MYIRMHVEIGIIPILYPNKNNDLSTWWRPISLSTLSQKNSVQTSLHNNVIKARNHSIDTALQTTITSFNQIQPHSHTITVTLDTAYT